MQSRVLGSHQTTVERPRGEGSGSDATTVRNDETGMVKAAVVKQWWNTLCSLFDGDPSGQSVGSLLQKLRDADAIDFQLMEA